MSSDNDSSRNNRYVEIWKVLITGLLGPVIVALIWVFLDRAPDVVVNNIDPAPTEVATYTAVAISETLDIILPPDPLTDMPVPPTATSTSLPVPATSTHAPSSTDTPLPTAIHTPKPTNTLVSVSSSTSIVCSFITELVSKGQITQVLPGENGAAGVQITLSSPVDVPSGWTVHNNGQEYEGPFHFDVGTFASFWGPDSCQPLNIPSTLPNDYACEFIDELVEKGEVTKVLQGGTGAAGVQIRLVEGVDVPSGWTVHNQGTPYPGPIHFDSGTFASFWAPSFCEPLTIPKY